MIDQSELTSLGKGIAQDYLNSGISLSEGLQKIANQKSLSKPQIARVAETANVETYLKMLKTADNKYIQFDLADPDSISGQSKKASDSSATDRWVDDYEQAPKYQFETERLFGELPDQPEREDTAGQLKQAQQTKGKLSFIKNRLDEACINVDANMSSLFHIVKQAHLPGTPIDQLHTVIKKASPETFSYIWPRLSSRLDENGIKVAESVDLVDKFVNTESSLFKAANAVEESIYKTAKLHYAWDHTLDQYKQTDLYDENHNLVKLSGVFGGLLKFIKNHPKLSGATALGATTYHAGKNKGFREQGQILQKAIVDTRPNKKY